MRLLAILLVSFCSLMMVQGQGIEFAVDPVWKDVVKKAKKQDKYIFVDCYTKWCGPCKNLSRSVFPQQEIGEFYNEHFVNVKYDMEEPNGMAMGEIYKGEVRSFPTMLYINPKTGKIVHKVVGFKKADVLITEAKKSLEGGGLVELQSRYDAGERDFEFMKVYLTAMGLAGKDREVLQIIDHHFQNDDTLSNLLKKDKWEFYGNYISDLHLGYVQYIVKNKYKFNKQAFVNRFKLEEDLRSCVDSEMRELFHLKAEKGTNYLTLPVDGEKLEFVKMNLQAMSRMDGWGIVYSKLCIYEQLKADEWEKAYHSTNAAVDFKYPYAKNARTKMFSYIVQECNDKALLQTIYEDFKRLQMEGQRQFSTFSLYKEIAMTADKLGLTEEAEVARKKSEEIRAQREATFGKPIKKGKH